MRWTKYAFNQLAMTAFISLSVAGAALSGDEAGPPVPDPQDLIDLVRATVLSVDAGNRSGDYAALFEMGSTAFQAANPPERLAANFARLRSRKLDLSPVRTKTPLTTRAPTIDRNGLLRILGFFEIGRVQLVYDVVYNYDTAAKRWRVAAVTVNPRDIPEQPVLIQPQ